MNLRLTVPAAIVAAVTLAATRDRAAAASTAALEHGTLTITGRRRERRARAARDAALQDPRVDFGDDGTPDAAFKLRKVERIRVRAGGGDDAVRVDESSLAFTDRVPTTIEGEDGFDSVRYDGSEDDERFRVSAKGTRVRSCATRAARRSTSAAWSRSAPRPAAAPTP